MMSSRAGDNHVFAARPRAVVKEHSVPKGILIVESRPSSPEHVAEYNRWYDEQHLRDVMGVAGFVAARRFAPVDDDGPFVAIYEIEADDLHAALDGLREAAMRGHVVMSD